MIETPALTYSATSRLLAGPEHMHYHVAGEGPVLLMLHGSGPGVSAWANFAELLPALATHYTVIMPDLPGYGGSYVPSLDTDYGKTAIAAVRRVLEAEGAGRIQIVGNSLGGMLAVRHAIEFPNVVERIVAMGPGGVGFPVFGPQPTEGIKRLTEFTFDPTREKLLAWMQSMVGDASFLTSERVDARWESARAPESLAFTRDFYKAALASMKRAPAAPLWARLGEVSCPVLLVYGQDDRVTPLESAFLPLRLLSDAELHVIPGAGHWVMLERPTVFTRVVLEFLGRD